MIDKQIKGTVLIVDDEPLNIQVLSQALSPWYRIKAATNGKTALDIASSDDPPDLILLDIKMPGLTGLELQRRLIELSESTPIVFMSGGCGAPEAVQALKNGASDFLVKPFEEEALLNAVSEALQKVRLDQESEANRDSAATLLGRLTARELQIAKLVISGALNRDIAEQLGIAVRTVKLHRMHMMHKLQVSNVIELTRIMDRHA